jgi:hypothetical protein
MTRPAQQAFSILRDHRVQSGQRIAIPRLEIGPATLVDGQIALNSLLTAARSSGVSGRSRVCHS